MRVLGVIFAVGLLSTSSYVFSQEANQSPDVAQFIAQLSKRAPTHDGVSLREYKTDDLDKDGVPEVLEIVNPIEEKNPGFLNVELSPAFEWINVFKKIGGQYVNASDKFPSFLRTRQEFYMAWLDKFKDTSSLSADSQNLVKTNRKEFVYTLEDYVQRASGLIEARPNKSLKPTNPAQGDR